MTMPELQEWTKALLERGEVYAVGGAVRDRVLGVEAPPFDDDFLVRGVPFEDVTRILGSHGAVQFVGRSFGVLKFSPHGSGRVVDLSLPRTERSTGTGHRDFEVDFDPDLPVEEDLGRRDFTMNALARNLATGELVDPHGGCADIEARIVRMIFPRAFEEDPLRILRAARFAAQLDFEIEPATREAMAEASDLVDTISAERVGDEWDQVLVRCPSPGIAIEIQREAGALGPWMPELLEGLGVDQRPFHKEDVYHHGLTTCDRAPRGNLEVRWAALLHDLGKARTRREVRERDGTTRPAFYGHERVSAQLARTVLNRMRRAKERIARVIHLVAEHMYYYDGQWSDGTVRRFIRRVGRDRLDDLFSLREADRAAKGDAPRDDLQDELEARIAGVIEADEALGIGDLEVDGREVMRETGLGPGPEVGRVLRALLESVLDDPSLNRKEELLRLARREADRIREE
jgi:tRNA nucleotidyltransferase (CCA-adding enzyme)